jgi:hypothetical protein
MVLTLGCRLLGQVELLSWKSIKDIGGDGGVIKTVEKEGTGWSKPGDADEALGAPPWTSGLFLDSFSSVELLILVPVELLILVPVFSPLV